MAHELSASTLEQFVTFGDFLRFLRRRASLTQMELATAVGYSDAQISRLEQNLRLPDIPTVQARFVPALGVENERNAVSRLLDLAANVRREDAPGLGSCPYMGLSYFDEADAERFVGREALTAKLLQRVLEIASGEPQMGSCFLAIVGASGSGKSSLARAGLLPAIRGDETSADWQIHVITPGAHPLASLAASLTEEAGPAAAAALMDDMAREPRSLQLFAQRRLASSRKGKLLILVDQLEELFTLCRSETERSAFIDCLLTAASEPYGAVLVVAALRADFYAHCAAFPALRAAIAHHQEYIGAMTAEELRRAIEEPARRGRWDLEPGVVDVLLQDVGREPGALPLLSHALMETWQRRRGRLMTLGGYASSGGVRRAIAETAEFVFVDQFTRDQQTLARRLFLRLTEVGAQGETTQDSRRRVTFDELQLDHERANPMRKVLQRLSDARLITTGEQSIEIAHEALIREWPRLRAWLDEDRQDLLTHRRITEAAREWAAGGRDAEMLYRGARLAEAEEWRRHNESELNPLEREFLLAAVAGRERELEEREARQRRELAAAEKLAVTERQHAQQLGRRAMYLGAAVVMALAMALTALFFAAQSRQSARTALHDRRIASARELSAAALNNLAVDPERSVLLALQAVSTTRSVDGTVLPEAVEAVHRALVASPVRMTLAAHGIAVMSVAYQPDGARLASIGRDGTVIIWDAASGEEVLRVPGTTTPSDQITTQRLQYSPDGRLLLVCEGHDVVLLDPASGAILSRMSGHSADVTAVAFSRDGTMIASGDAAGGLIVWDAATGKLVAKLDGHTNALESVTFSPSGGWLVSAGDDAQLKIWDVKSGTLLQTYADFTGVVGPAEFSPDGSLLAFATEDGLHLWSLDVSTAEGKLPFTNHGDLTISGGSGVAFSPDGTRVVTGAPTAVWDSRTGRQILNLVGHTDWVMGMAFSPDGEHVASAGTDGSVKIWDVGPGQETVAVHAAPASFGTRLAYDPTRNEFATNGGDGSATIWNASTGERRLTLTGHSQEVLAVAYSADGRRLATGSMDGSAIVWDPATGAKLLTLRAHEQGVRDVAFSPDGKRLATGGFDGAARIWDLATGEQLHEFRHEQGLVIGVAFNADGTRLATSSTDATVKVWDAVTGALLFTLQGNTVVVPDLTYSPDGSKLVTAGKDGLALVWDAATGKQLVQLHGHRGEIQAVTFSPDGTLIATSGGDNTARLWNATTGEEVLRLPGSQIGNNGVAFALHDGAEQLLVASNDGVVRGFLLRLDELLALAQRRVTRPLTADECREFLHAAQCPQQVMPAVAN